MLKISARILALAALGLAVAAPRPVQAASANDHAAPTNWSRAYVLTPLEHKRLRAYGLKDEEVFLIANAASNSWYDVDFLVQLYLCHYYTELQAIEYLNRTPESLKSRHPEWTTPEWQEAVKRGDYAWIPPQPPMGKRSPSQ
jgi:hypothetical protein